MLTPPFFVYIVLLLTYIVFDRCLLRNKGRSKVSKYRAAIYGVIVPIHQVLWRGVHVCSRQDSPSQEDVT